MRSEWFASAGRDRGLFCLVRLPSGRCSRRRVQPFRLLMRLRDARAFRLATVTGARRRCEPQLSEFGIRRRARRRNTSHSNATSFLGRCRPGPKRGTLSSGCLALMRGGPELAACSMRDDGRGRPVARSRSISDAESCDRQARKMTIRQAQDLAATFSAMLRTGLTALPCGIGAHALARFGFPGLRSASVAR